MSSGPLFLTQRHLRIEQVRDADRLHVDPCFREPAVDQLLVGAARGKADDRLVIER